MEAKLSKKQMVKTIVESQGKNFNTWLKEKQKEAKQAILIEENSEWHNVIRDAIFDQLLEETLIRQLPKSQEKKKESFLKESKESKSGVEPLNPNQ